MADAKRDASSGTGEALSKIVADYSPAPFEKSAFMAVASTSRPRLPQLLEGSNRVSSTSDPSLVDAQSRSAACVRLDVPYPNIPAVTPGRELGQEAETPGGRLRVPSILALENF